MSDFVNFGRHLRPKRATYSLQPLGQPSLGGVGAKKNFEKKLCFAIIINHKKFCNVKMSSNVPEYSLDHPSLKHTGPLRSRQIA